MEITVSLTDIDREQLEDGLPVVWYFGEPPEHNRVTIQFTKVGK
ncbi:MAG: hypothetical protein U9P49_04295 [Thermodesulfobacteriota bacterium]|nr:hypothetical protein [Thermodesulfobacteriota bacterium]